MLGEAGISGEPSFDWHIGADADYDGYEAMIGDGDGVWHFDITVNWRDFAGEVLYYKAEISDGAGNTVTSAEYTEVIEAIPTISITTPTDGQLYPPVTILATLTVDIANHGGHWHWQLDMPFPANGPAKGNQVASGDSGTITGLRDGQTYTVYTALVDGDGNMLDPAVTASVTFSVDLSEEAAADFIASVLPTETTASPGGFASYLIKLEGKNGFDGTIELYSADLPPNIEATLDPEIVTLSAENPLGTSQLTLMIPADTVSAGYPFTVLAMSEAGETKKLGLTLKVKSIPLAPTSLTFILQPAGVEFMGELDLVGQLTALTDVSAELGDAVIQIIFAAPSEKTYIYEARTDVEGNYQLATPFSPEEVGEWSIKARFDGNEQLKSSERERTFTVEKGESEIVFDTGTANALGIEIMVLGRLEPQLEEELISLKILRPDGSASTLTGITTEALGVFRYPLKLDMSGDWAITATWPGNDNWEAVTRTLSISVSEEMGKVIIVLGGGNKADNPAWTTFNRVAEYVHRVFRRRNFHDDDIYFLSPDPNLTANADNVTSATALEFAITNWAAKQVNAEVPLYVYLLSHNLGDHFLLEKHGDQETYLTPAQLDRWLDELPESTPVTIIIEACYSGNFIRTSQGEPTVLVAPDRTIIVSARGDRQAKLLANGSSFSKLLFDRIGANKTVGEAFRETELLMERIPFHREQHPQFDADGDGKVNTPQDYAEVAHRYLPADMVSLANPPNIIDITLSQTLPAGIASLEINVELLGVDITHVFATVVPPDYDPDQEVSNWSELSFPEFDLKLVSSDNSRHEYAVTYTDFTIPGDYTIVIGAENADGSADPVQTTITVPGHGAAFIMGDVNGDGMVRSNDAIVALRISVGLMTPSADERRAADMNDDGQVRSDDVILILRKIVGLAAPGRGVAADFNTPVTVTLDLAYSATGDNLTIAMMIDNAGVLAGGDICLSYDSSALQAVGVSSDSAMLLAGNLAQPGLLRIAFASASPSDGKTLMKIRFEVVADRASPLVFQDIQLYGHNAHPLNSRGIDSSFRSYLLPPEHSALLQNFPNPFNPETWIPYQLSESREVNIRIFDSAGGVVRQLALGYRDAGSYTSQDRAAYWDGRNEAGESVASGIYFYAIKAGDFVAVKKTTVAR